MTLPEREELRKLAESATPGPWFNCKYARTIKNYELHKFLNIFKYPMRTDCYPISHEEYIANADYVAAANPQTILRLLDYIDLLEKEICLLKTELK